MENIIKLPRDQLFIDYLSYRAWEISGLVKFRDMSFSMLEMELSSICQEVNIQNFIYNSISNNESYYYSYSAQDFISALKIEYNNTCLTKEDFTWLEDHNTRQIFYVWRLLSHLADNNERRYGFEYETEFGKAKSLAHMKKLISQEVTKNDIIIFINRLDCQKYQKNRLVNSMKTFSVDSLECHTLIKWFAKDCDKKTDWAYSYLTKQTKEYIPLITSGSSQLKNDIISFFDVIYGFNKYRCQLLILNMKKAWDTQTYRDKNTGKKRHSVDMSHDIDNLLKEMCAARNEHKNHLIERLIRAEYQTFKE